MSYDGDPEHPIVELAWEYEILRFCYEVVPEDRGSSFIDLTLRRAGVVRRLRFLAPQRLEIGEGFPSRTGGLCILDVRGRQMEGLGVRVADFKATWGSVRFWAREVVDLDCVS
jgi:hypothetical protein